MVSWRAISLVGKDQNVTLGPKFVRSGVFGVLVKVICNITGNKRIFSFSYISSTAKGSRGCGGVPADAVL